MLNQELDKDFLNQSNNNFFNDSENRIQPPLAQNNLKEEMIFNKLSNISNIEPTQVIHKPHRPMKNGDKENNQLIVFRSKTLNSSITISKNQPITTQ